MDDFLFSFPVERPLLGNRTMDYGSYLWDSGSANPTDMIGRSMETCDGHVRM